MSKQGQQEAIQELETSQNSSFQSAELILSGDDYHSVKLNAQYMLNLLNSVDHNSKIAYKICSAAEQIYRSDIADEGMVFPKGRSEDDTGRQYYHSSQRTPRHPVAAEDWGTLKKYFTTIRDETPDSKPQPIYENLMRLTDYLDLKQTEKDVLEFSYAAENDMQFLMFMKNFVDGDKGRVAPAVACMLGAPQKVKDVHKALDESGPLMSYGLLGFDLDAFGEPVKETSIVPGIDEFLREALASTNMSEDEIVSAIVGESMNAELDLDDFSYKGEELEFLKEFIGNAVEQNRKGINILLYGPPGSGKTALASALSKDLGMKMYAAGENQDDAVYGSPASPTSSKRLASLLQMQAMLKDSKKTVLLFDEIEDLLLKGTDSSKNADTESKIQINRLLENNDVVTIWTGNDPEKFHEAVRQRFTMSLHMGYPPVQIRQKIWERQLEMQDVKLKPEETRELARKYQAPPRMIAKAARAAAISGKGIETIGRSLESDARISFGSLNAIMDDMAVSPKFDLALMNGGEDLQDKVEGLIERGQEHRPFSLLVEGKPGTGVGSLLRYMGESMVMNVSEVSMAALMTPTPFSTPAQNIQMTFEKAATEGEFLVIHDVDMIVPDPANAGNTAQWSEGLVQHFNKCAAGHGVPFAVTNTSDAKLPEVFTHRYTAKIELDSLKAEQSCKAFKTYFGADVPADRTLPENLLIADFANTSRLAYHMDASEKSPEKMCTMLEKQKELRGGVRMPRIGFQAK